MTDISGYGLRIRVLASETFPVGFDITQFADDTDPFDFPSMQIADSAMGLNGDQISWTTANSIAVSISVVPGSPEDINLGILFEANRAGKGKTPARDNITMIGMYGDDKFITLIKGIISEGMPGNAVASSGRMKSKTYSFRFENKVQA